MQAPGDQNCDGELLRNSIIFLIISLSMRADRRRKRFPSVKTSNCTSCGFTLRPIKSSPKIFKRFASLKASCRPLYGYLFSPTVNSYPFGDGVILMLGSTLYVTTIWPPEIWTNSCGMLKSVIVKKMIGWFFGIHITQPWISGTKNAVP